jgi:hypothetical protein
MPNEGSKAKESGGKTEAAGKIKRTGAVQGFGLNPVNLATKKYDSRASNREKTAIPNWK